MSSETPTLPTILLVEPDDTVRPILKDNLRRWGYAVIIALDTDDAFERTQDGNAPADLILINQYGQAIAELIAIGEEIRQRSTRSNQIPVVVLAETYGADLEGQDIQVGDREYVVYLEDGEQLKNLLYRLCPSR